jgi:hypothetical protein
MPKRLDMLEIAIEALFCQLCGQESIDYGM